MLTEHLKFNEYKIGLIRAALDSEYGYVTPVDDNETVGDRCCLNRLTIWKRPTPSSAANCR